MVVTDYVTEATKSYLSGIERQDRQWEKRVAPIDTEGRPLLDNHDYIVVDDGEKVYVPDTAKAIKDYLTDFIGRDQSELSDDKVDLFDDIQEVDPFAEVIPWTN